MPLSFYANDKRTTSAHGLSVYAVCEESSIAARSFRYSGCLRMPALVYEQTSQGVRGF